MAQYLTEEERFRQMMQEANLAEDEQNPLDSIDFEKIAHIFRRNWYWLFIFPALLLFSAYLYLRYTKPVFQSTSTLKMEIKNENEGIGLRLDMVNTNMDNIAGELEVIRSPIIYEEVAKKLDLYTLYFAEGRILDNEMYSFAPISLEAKTLDNGVYGHKFYIQSEDNINYTLRRVYNKNLIAEYKGKFNEKLITQEFEFLIKSFKPLKEYSENIFFVINSKAATMSYLANNLEAVILNPQAKTIGLSFKDFDASKAKDVLNVLSEVYRVKSIEIKNRANKQKQEYLDEQIAKTEKELNGYEAEMERFIIENKTNNIEGKIGELVAKIQQLTEERIKLNAKLQNLIELEIFVNQRFVSDKNIPILPDVDVGILSQITELNRLKLLRQEQELSETANTYSYQKFGIQINALQKNISESIERYKQKIFKDME